VKLVSTAFPFRFGTSLRFGSLTAHNDDDVVGPLLAARLATGLITSSCKQTYKLLNDDVSEMNNFPFHESINQELPAVASSSSV
jgi:hypothetical protein